MNAGLEWLQAAKNPNPVGCAALPPLRGAPSRSSPSLKFRSLVRPRVRAASRLHFQASPPQLLNAGLPFYPLPSKPTRWVLSLAASHEESRPEKDEDDLEAEGSEEAWHRVLESFKEQALKTQSVSQEAYEVYRKKAIVILKEASEQLRIQADKTRNDLAVLAKEIGEESKEYLSVAAENSPEPVKEIVETYSSSTSDVKEISQLQDFHVGIPYGFLLSVGGFLSFMFTGSTAAIRFGIILGSALLASSVRSLKSHRKGESPALFLRGQAAISAIIFLREIRLLFQGVSFFTFLTAVISGTIAAFFLYRIRLDSWPSASPDVGHGSEN